MLYFLKHQYNLYIFLGCIDLVGYEDASVMEEYWLRSLGLSLEDRQCLRKGGWLTDSVINAGQVLLRTDYTQIGGLQPTTLGEVLGFITSQGSAFVQVIHTAGSHWITASNVGFQEGVVGIYENIASIVHTNNPKMIIIILPRNTGTKGCQRLWIVCISICHFIM